MVLPSGPFGLGCRALKCPPDSVPYGKKCEAIGEPSPNCLRKFVMRVTPFGNGICGCPPYFEFVDSVCIPETELKTVFSIPNSCDEGFFLRNNEECVQVVRAANPDERNIKKREFLALPDRNRRLVAFLRNRIG